jgi:homocitrate synthase NifV
MPEFLFIDKTLAYALRNNKINRSGYIELKQKIADMTDMIFDVPIDFYNNYKDLKDNYLNNVRICIEPEAEQVITAYEMGCRWIKITLKDFASDRKLAQIRKTLKKATYLNMKITVGCMELSENLFTLKNNKLLNFILDCPVHSVIVHDYKSRLDPISTYQILSDIKRIIPAQIEYGGKNGMGLATGNTLCAVKSGINTITTSVGGIGGFPAYEEVIMGINRLLKMPIEVPDGIAICCKEVLEYMGIEIPKTKPIIGSNIFAHESGIHVDGVYKKSELYEPFAPEEVGLSRKIIIGKHSGKAALEQKIRELNLNIKACCIMTLLENVRSLAIKQKAALEDEQFKQLVKEVAFCDG